MKKWIFLLLFYFSLTTCRAQSMELDTKLNTKERTIQSSFDNLTIQTYAVQGQLKVEELVEYLKLLSGKNNSQELNQQLKISIEQLFSEDFVRLSGIESKELFFSPLKWLENWENAVVELESVKLIDSKLQDTYWIYTYQIGYWINGKQKTKPMEIRVNFQPHIKTFGNSQKEVWELKIRAIVFK